ncbi:MAG: hypothetical protein HY344_00035 [Candidatus Levybacteria bacterium]|nr:hypothetical protein [Candidatus Levybacteria bacterium]
MVLSVPVRSRRTIARPVIAAPSVGKEREAFSPPVHIEVRPTEPLEIPPPPSEPVYGSVSAKQWEIWVQTKEEYVIFLQRRDRARTYAAENDLRGVPFS